MAIGFYGKLYYRSAGSYNSPTFTEVDILSDVTLTSEWDKADAPTRESRIKKYVKTMFGVEVACKMQKRPGNAQYEAFMNAMLTDETLDILVLDNEKTTNDTRGFRFDAQVFSATEDQNLTSTMYEDMKICPTISDNPVKAVKVTGGVLTYYEPGGSAVSFA